MVNNLIEIYDDAVSPELCDYFIEWFENQSHYGNTMSGMSGRGVDKLTKNSEDIPVNELILLGDKTHRQNCDILIDNFNKCSIDYHDKYFTYSSKKEKMNSHNLDGYTDEFLKLSYEIPYLNFQKYKKGEGHFKKMHEDWSGVNWNRHVVMMVYLNDVEKGGETEFIHQKLKIRPKKGTIILFPPYYTHLHRGNIPVSDDKYIITSWYRFLTRGNPPWDIGFYFTEDDLLKPNERPFG